MTSENSYVTRLKKDLSFDVQNLFNNMMPDYQISYAEYVYKDVHQDITILKRRKNLEKSFRKLMVEDYYFVAPMSDFSATEISSLWHYPSPYSKYDVSSQIETYEEMSSKRKRYNTYFQVVRNGELFGYAIYRIKEGVCHLNFGMKPHYTGHGYGSDFIKAIENFGKNHYSVTDFVVQVDKDNERVMALLSKSGFQLSHDEISDTCQYEKHC